MSKLLYGCLSTDPPILYHTSSDEIQEYLPDEPVTRLITYWWHYQPEEIAVFHQRDRRLRRQDSLHHLVNEAAVARQLVAWGIPAHFISQNALVDEEIFTIHSGVEKTFDAVYNARMNPFKRHILAARIPSLRLIGGVMAVGDTQDYHDEVLAALPQAQYVSTSPGNWKYPPEIATLLNQARVGLCLSASEGAMYASIEYLLCGLPVVSTVADGGRAEFFDPRYTRIVPDDPDAVAAAVRELIERQIPPKRVRTETLARVWEHRRRLFDLGQLIYSAHHTGRDFARDFYRRYTNKAGNWNSLSEIRTLLGRQESQMCSRTPMDLRPSC